MANQKGQMLRSLFGPEFKLRTVEPTEVDLFQEVLKQFNLWGECCDPYTSRPSSFDPFEGVKRTRASADGRVVQLPAFENQNHIQER